jgi:hypothetical protein
MQLFLDCDGVLADFDIYAEKIFGLPPRNAEGVLGATRFWADLQSHDGFYEKLPLMPDARELFEAVEHLNPIILTGLPQGDWAEPQKRLWGAGGRHINAGPCPIRHTLIQKRNGLGLSRYLQAGRV